MTAVEPFLPRKKSKPRSKKDIDRFLSLQQEHEKKKNADLVYLLAEKEVKSRQPYRPALTDMTNRIAEYTQDQELVNQTLCETVHEKLYQSKTKKVRDRSLRSRED